MHENCDDIQALISAYLDGELGPSDRERVERHVAACDRCRKEFDMMKRLVSAASTLAVAPPPEEVWDTFLDNVYNRLERRAGWVIFIIGAVALAAYGLYLFLTEPGAAAIKLLIATPVVGLAVLFVSVLRQRLFAAKTDRYSREVKR